MFFQLILPIEKSIRIHLTMLWGEMGLFRRTIYFYKLPVDWALLIFKSGSMWF